MPLIHTLALAAGATEYRESDLLVTFFTEELGKLRALAKGAKRSKKRFGINLDLFSLVDLSLREKAGSGLALVDEASLVNPHLGLRQMLEKVALASYFLELTLELTPEREPNRQLFRLLISALTFLEKRDPDRKLVSIFEIQALSATGLAPELRQCSDCQEDVWKGSRVTFSPAKGSVVCPACQSGPLLGEPVSVGTLKTLAAGKILPWDRLNSLRFSAPVARESQALLEEFIKAQLDKELKSRRLLDRLVWGEKV